MTYLCFQKFKCWGTDKIVVFEQGEFVTPIVIFGKEDIDRLIEEWISNGKKK